jgi:hypothetical protein
MPQSIKDAVRVCNALPSNITVLFRGETGIGKSFVAAQLASGFGIPVIDRRLSQMTEGDMLGLPSTDGEVTRFNPPDWYKRACREPVMLFLDEFNRATTEVMQAGFQIVLDRELNGFKLHPDTRVYAAINIGGRYMVNEMDPALLRRFFVIDLAPTAEDWVVYAKAKELEPLVIDFISNNEAFLDPPSKEVEPNQVVPTRASWERLSAALKHADVSDKHEEPLFYAISLGFVGIEASIALQGFAKTFNAQVSGEDILERYPSVRKKVKRLGQERWNICIEKVVDWCIKECDTFEKANAATNGKDANGKGWMLTPEQGKNIGAFMEDLPHELRTSFWSKLSQNGGKHLAIIETTHKYVIRHVVEAFGAKKDDKKDDKKADKKGEKDDEKADEASEKPAKKSSKK